MRGLARCWQAAWQIIFSSEENNKKLDHLLGHLHLIREETAGEQVFAGKTFVITGSVEHFANRSEAKAFIEARGGKVTGSVTKKTDYLINNDKSFRLFQK